MQFIMLHSLPPDHYVLAANIQITAFAMRIPFDKYYFMPLPDGSGYDHIDRTNKVCIDYLIGSWLAARLCDDDTGVEHLRMWCGSDCIIATRRGIDVRVIVEHHNSQNV